MVHGAARLEQHSWCSCRETWDDYAARRTRATQLVADTWKTSNWGEQLTRQSATWLGHVSRAAVWPWRLLEWWPAQADETTWLLRRRRGNDAHPTSAAERSVANYARQWASQRGEACERRALASDRAAWAKMASAHAAHVSKKVQRVRGDTGAEV